MKKIIGIFSILFFISCTSSQEIKSISTIELKEKLTTDKIQLLDVRTSNEIKKGAIKTAVFVDFFADDFIAQTTNKIDKNKEVYLYCKSGGRSLKASKILQEKGFKVVNVLGGYIQWKKEN